MMDKINIFDSYIILLCDRVDNYTFMIKKWKISCKKIKLDKCPKTSDKNGRLSKNIKNEKLF